MSFQVQYFAALDSDPESGDEGARPAVQQQPKIAKNVQATPGTLNEDAAERPNRGEKPKR